MRKLYLCLLLFIIAFFPTSAQEYTAAENFELARKIAFSGNYEDAIQMLENLREQAPENTDYTIFLARVHSWQENYEEAITLLKPLIRDPFMPEAVKLLITVHLWAKKYEEMIYYADYAIGIQPEDPFYKTEKIKALIELGRTGEAKNIVEELRRESGSTPELEYLRTRIFQENKQEILLAYTNTSFSESTQKNWQQASLSYKRNIQYVPVIARFTYAFIREQAGTQFEVDAYPRISKSGYLYLNAGAAFDKDIFPEFRGGLEYFHGLKNGLSFSLGGKYLQFSSNEVFLYTGHISYTTRSAVRWTYRPFLSDIGDLTHTFSVRFTNELEERFFQVDLQYGTVPYEYFVTGNFTDLKTARAGLRYQFRLSEHFLMQPVFLFEYEEYQPSTYRNRYNGQLLTTFRF